MKGFVFVKFSNDTSDAVYKGWMIALIEDTQWYWPPHGNDTRKLAESKNEWQLNWNKYSCKILCQASELVFTRMCFYVKFVPVLFYLFCLFSFFVLVLFFFSRHVWRGEVKFSFRFDITCAAGNGHILLVYMITLIRAGFLSRHFSSQPKVIKHLSNGKRKKIGYKKPR